MPVLETRPAESDAFERLLTERVQPGASAQRSLRAVFAYAQSVYGDTQHWTGQTLMMHCLDVAEMYAKMAPGDYEGLTACLLHHILDSKKVTLEEIQQAYGPSVRSLVSAAHLLSHVTLKNKRMSTENLRLMFMRVSDDIRVVLLILCNHTCVLEHLEALTPEMSKTLCRDVLNVFAPVAARLGIYSLKHRMELIAFPVAYPTDAARIYEQLAQIHDRHGHFLDNVASTLRTLLKEAGIDARVEGREKQPYSVFQKMRNKSITHVEDVFDLFALRVIVEDEASCYQALGVLHRIGHPVVNRFKDYIAFQKPNGYQSLHTTLARVPGMPDGMTVEVQIRTPAMHREADLGIAAHWSYKEGGGAEHAKRRATLQRALNEQPLDDGHGRGDHIFALTPKGDIVELPEGATPLDFAFQVHSMLGLCFKAARVNGSIVPMGYQMENGDIVEILRHKEPHPTSNWMTMLKTSSAKAKLKQYLLSLNRSSYVLAGRDALNAEFARLHLPGLDPDFTILRVFDGKVLSYNEREDLLMSIGQGSKSAASVLPHLDALAPEMRQRFQQKKKATGVQSQPGLKSDFPMPLRYARCCKADEGQREELTGVVGRDGMIRVHRMRCKLLKQANPERLIKVWWEKGRKEAIKK